MRILIAESDGFSPVALARLQSKIEVVTADLDRAQLLVAVGDVDALWVRLRNRIDREVLEHAPSLRVLVTNTTGLNHIDLDAARERSVHVISLRGETDFLRTIRATAELTLALLLALVRKLPAACNHVRAGGWDRYGFQGHDLFGKTAGIVGYGRLGAVVSSYLKALGMRVTAATKEPHPPIEEIEVVPLHVLLPKADVVTVHVDLTSETHGLIGAQQFAAMKPGAWLVNTSRGEVVDEAALLAALESGHLGGAALDVLSDEHALVGRHRPLVQYAATHDNLLITPHIGGYTKESLARTEEFLADRLLAHFGMPPGHDSAAPAV